MEGLILDWAAVLIARDLGGGAEQGALAITAFSAAMFVSRTVGDRRTDRITEARITVCASVGIVAAAVVGVGSGSAPVLTLGVALIGLALGPLFPIALSRAVCGEPGRAASATARVSVVGYAAYLAGPPVIGGSADVITLPVAFALVAAGAAIAIGIAGGSGRTRR